MNWVAEEMLLCSELSGMDNPVAQDILIHYGMPRRSGRYPWGSGENPYQHEGWYGGDFISRIEQLKKDGWVETPENIMSEFGLTTGQYRIQKSLATNERKMLQVATAKSLAQDGLSATEIARKMSTDGKKVNESTVRGWLKSNAENRMQEVINTAEFIKSRVDEDGMIDVGKGVANELGISQEKLKQALIILESEGYYTVGGRVPQPTNPGQMTTLKVVIPPGTPYKVNDRGQITSSAIYDYGNIHSLNKYVTHDDGKTYDKFVYPASLDSKRVQVCYAEDGGIKKDGLVEIRRGVQDISLGNDRYAQVRILVDGTHYIKGMAVYADDLPDGVDIRFNTNKHKGTPMCGEENNTVLKNIKNDPDNPFGALVKAGGQSYYENDKGERRLSVINKTRAEGDWSEWANKVPSQFLSKQSLQLAKQQLNLAVADSTGEYAEICSLKNPTVKKYFLQKFADQCDSAAVHLQAAALPGQKYHVIIPINSLKETECYAPDYENGSHLALIRYPHGGTFEIPILTVNNKNTEAKKYIGSDSTDAVCVTKTVADRLSGADFDGDTVMCIPTDNPGSKVHIISTKPLDKLADFDPKSYAYTADEIASGNARIMRNTQQEMGVISNLITDMTLQGAGTDELARAVAHSMVVIDAEKHKLNYKQSYLDNNIAALKKEYQDGGGASTLISRAKSQASVLKTQGSGVIDPKTGKITYKIADDLYYPERSYDKDTGIVTLVTTSGKKVAYDVKDAAAREKYEPVKTVVDEKTGKSFYGDRITNKDGTIEYRVNTRMQKTTKMAATDDARTLISTMSTPMEEAYADYANAMKSLANQARKEMMATGRLEYDKEARKAYATEVSSLMAKLNESLKNKPRERLAQLRTNAEVATKIQNNPNLKKDEIKKANQQAMTRNRNAVGSVARRDRVINITDSEWEAIQSGAVSENILKQILDNTDADALRQRATPRTTSTLSAAQQAKIRSMAASSSDYTLAQIAAAVGVSTSTVSKYLKSA